MLRPRTVLALLLACIFVRPSAADDPKAVEFFEAKIRPVLVDKCYKCHSQTAD